MSTSNDGPLNTTEHIFRQLEAILDELRKENDEFKWDFPSFIVTLVIGIIAAVFAGIAIVQALLVAGPGRLKSGKYAIGPWAKLTCRSFGSELRLRTTSETPVIAFEAANWDLVVKEVHANYELIVEAQWEAQDRDRTFLKSILRRCEVTPREQEGGHICDCLRKDPQDHFPATRLALLTTLDLDEPSFWTRKRVAADYIPSDLSAVPAYGRVRDITNLVLVACRGMANLDFGADTGHRLPLVRGDIMNLSFQDHPLLGLVGSFDLLSSLKVSLYRHSSARALSLAHGIGLFCPVGGPVLTVSYTSSSNNGSRILRFFETTFLPKPSHNSAREFITKGCLQRHNQQTLACRHWLCAESGDWPVDPQVPDDIMKQHHQYLAIAFAAVTALHSDVAPVFPVARASIHSRFHAFIIQSRAWSSGLTCFGIAFHEIDWEEGAPEYPARDYLVGIERRNRKQATGL